LPRCGSNCDCDRTQNTIAELQGISMADLPRPPHDELEGPSKAPRRRWFQYSIRSLLIVTTLISLPVGWLAIGRINTAKERAARDRFHQLIRDAEIAIQPKAVDLPWEKVEAMLAEAGHTLISSNPTQHRCVFRHLIRLKAWRDSNGTPYDVVIESSVYRPESPHGDLTQFNNVTEIDAGLFGMPNLPYTQAIQKKLFPPGSAVSLCLVESEVREAANTYPILKEVEIKYGLLHYHRSSEVPFSFHVDVTLGKSTSNDDEGIAFYFTVQSNLDPIQDWNGQQLPGPFTRSSELGEVTRWGSNQWSP
jgi:hypothetical protein